MDLKEKLRHVLNFPKEGIDFIDITTVLQDGEAFAQCIDEVKELVSSFGDIDIIVGPESRGFVIGAPLAYSLKKGFVPVRKKGKLPFETISASYQLEYGMDSLEMHSDSIRKGQKVVIVDDLLATGGTTGAMIELVEKLGGEVVGLAYFVELNFLQGRSKLSQYNVKSLVQF